jgi:EmrB/QacA subfamily drug resistance transporter
MSASTRVDQPETSTAKRGLGLALLVVATAQLMLVLDDTIANVALPSIQRDLGVLPTTLPWIVNAYVLAFGSLLLFGGRLGDLYGRRRVLQIGLGVFTAASLFGGLGVNAEMLIGSRALQGLGAALVAPNVLALIATTFPAGPERNRAVAIYGAMSALGITLGVLLGGVLTGALSWRWVFFINVPIGLVVLFGTKALVEAQRLPGRLDNTDAVIATSAMFGLAYGVTRGGEHGWSDPLTLGLLAGAALLAAAFLWLQRRRAQPMLPLRLFRDRNRSGAYASVVFIGGGLMATYYLLTLYMQQVLQFSPIQAGLASLPVSFGIVLSAGIASKLVARLAPRVVAVPGLLIAAAGLLWLSTLEPGSSYLAHVLPGIFVTYFGLGMGFLPMALTAVHGLGDDEAGVGSALLNTAQQIGAGLGLAVLATVATSAANQRAPEAGDLLRDGLAGVGPERFAAAAEALTHGYTTGFVAGAVMLVVAALIVGLSVTTARTQAAQPGVP